MLYLQELLDKLAYGEFAHMSISNPLPGSNFVDHMPKLVSFINDGLLDLYTRFQIKSKEMFLHQRVDKNLYYIRSSHMGDPLAGDSEIYIDGTVDDPPAGDILRFIEAFDEDQKEVHINSLMFPDEITTPEYDVIKMVPSDPVQIISIVYQASYPKIVVTDELDPATYELFFPPYLKRALLANVASTPFKDKAKKTGEGDKSHSLLYRYEMECNKLSELGLLPNKDTAATVFEKNGWV